MAQPSRCRTLPDGYTDAMRALAEMLIVGAETLHRDCRSGDVSDRYHACICQAVDVGHR